MKIPTAKNVISTVLRLYNVVSQYKAVALLVLCLGLTAYAHHQGVVAGRRGELLKESQAEVALQKRAVAVLQKSIKTQDSTSKEKSKSYTQAKIVYRKVRDSIYVTDTVEIPQIVQLADSAIEAADSVIEAQKVGIALRDSVIAGQAKQIDALNKEIRLTVQSKPSRFSKVVTAGKWLAVGAVIGRALK